MAKTKISEWDSTPNGNTDINSINIAEGCAPSGINDAIRAMMAQVKDLYAGTSGDTLSVASGGTGATTSTGTGSTVLSESPAFTGTPTAPTAPQFDNDTSLATTAFVQRAIGNFANNRPRSINAAVTLTGADSGTCFELGSSAAVTLPLCSSVPPGTVFIFTTSQAVTTATINRQGASDTLAINNGGAYTSYTMGSGSDIMFINDGTIWRGNFGQETLRTNSALFAASKAPSGYQKLPSGLIFQWGSVNFASSITPTWTYPIAFPNNCCHVFTAVLSNGTNTFTAYSKDINGLASTTIYKSTDGIVAYTVSCFAIGY